jgi:predicted RNase H-like nuclease
MRASQGGSGSPCRKGRSAPTRRLRSAAWSRRPPLAVIAVDIPIGLPDTGRRQADILARKAVGPLWPSVFMTPVRPAMEAPDYATAADLSRRLAGEGISRQAFALQAKILQVDRWVRETPHRVVEVHPEASFAELAGAALQSRKSRWAGTVLRRRLLAGAGISLPDDLGPAAEKAAVDDVLDAAAAAWTAVRVLRGQALSTPPESPSISGPQGPLLGRREVGDLDKAAAVAEQLAPIIRGMNPKDHA